ncbi:MAG: hypothetical protein Fur0016_03790 [Anaerolineales bacterium]
MVFFAVDSSFYPVTQIGNFRFGIAAPTNSPLDIEQTFMYYLFIERMSDFDLRRERIYDDGAKIQRLKRAAS